MDQINKYRIIVAHVVLELLYSMLYFYNTWHILQSFPLQSLLVAMVIQKSDISLDDMFE